MKGTFTKVRGTIFLISRAKPGRYSSTCNWTNGLLHLRLLLNMPFKLFIITRGCSVIGFRFSRSAQSGRRRAAITHAAVRNVSIGSGWWWRS